MDENDEMKKVHDWLNKDLELLCGVMASATMLVDYHYDPKMDNLRKAVVAYYEHRNQGIQ